MSSPEVSHSVGNSVVTHRRDGDGDGEGREPPPGLRGGVGATGTGERPRHLPSLPCWTDTLRACSSQPGVSGALHRHYINRSSFEIHHFHRDPRHGGSHPGCHMSGIQNAPQKCSLWKSTLLKFIYKQEQLPTRASSRKSKHLSQHAWPAPRRASPLDKQDS